MLDPKRQECPYHPYDIDRNLKNLFSDRGWQNRTVLSYDPPVHGTYKGNDFWIMTYPAWKDDMRERVAGMMDHQLMKGFGG